MRKADRERVLPQREPVQKVVVPRIDEIRKGGAS